VVRDEAYLFDQFHLHAIGHNTQTVSYVITCCLPFCRVFADVTRRRYWAAVRGKVDITFICPPCKDDVLAQVAAENRSMAVDDMDDDHDAAEAANVSVADNDDVDDEDEQHQEEAIMDVSNDDHSGTSYLWSPYVILVKQQYLLHVRTILVIFDILAAAIVSLLWRTAGNFTLFCVLIGSVTARQFSIGRQNRGATYIRQGGHHVGHRLHLSES